jgi:hypothetical protein
MVVHFLFTDIQPQQPFQVTTMSNVTTLTTNQDTPALSFQGTGRTLGSNSPDTPHEHTGEFLPANNGVTGLEPNTNPPDWPSNQRRVPAHRPPVVHDDWVLIGGPRPMRLFLWTMFHGCELLRVGLQVLNLQQLSTNCCQPPLTIIAQWLYTFPTQLGLHERGYFQYQVAGEW